MTEHRTTTLASGVRVISERIENVRSVALGFWIGTGSAMESDRQAGMSHLLEHMLFRGTDRYRSHEIDEIFDAMGAEINAGTDHVKALAAVHAGDGSPPGARVRRRRRGWCGGRSSNRWRPSARSCLEEIAMYEDDPQDRVFDVLGEAVLSARTRWGAR